MNIGTLIRIAECIVTIYCGVRLAVRPAKMRWEHNAAKIIFCVLVIGAMVYESANTFWFKFSSITSLMVAVYLFVVLFVFYKISFVQLLAQNFLYWFTIILGRMFVISICCAIKSMEIFQYITVSNGEPWHWIHIVSMLVTMGISVLLLYVKRGKPLIIFQSKKDYFWIMFFVFCEEVVNEAIFGSKNKFDSVYLIFSGFALWGMASLLIIFYIHRMYLDGNEKEKVLEMNIEMLRNQYTMLQNLYTEKSIQVHDAVNHDILLIQYLRENQNEVALEYLEKKLDKERSGKKQDYTGIPAIDLMLDYKIHQAKKYDIEVDIKVSAYFCPFEDTEICIVLGNLFDNSMEAVRDLPQDKRRIQIVMKTPNDIFLLSIKNPYEGKRKKAEGYYVTTKPDKKSHGLGLKSVEKIVHKYNGMLEVMDDAGEFMVVVTAFGVRGQ